MVERLFWLFCIGVMGFAVGVASCSPRDDRPAPPVPACELPEPLTPGGGYYPPRSSA